MNEVKDLEEQPLPAVDASNEEVNQRMGAAVQQLGNALMARFQANGNVFNALELELKCTVMGEAIHMLCALVVELSAGKYTDTSITETMIARLDAVSAAITESTKTPRLFIPQGRPPQKMNGSKHN